MLKSTPATPVRIRVWPDVLPALQFFALRLTLIFFWPRKACSASPISLIQRAASFSGAALLWRASTGGLRNCGASVATASATRRGGRDEHAERAESDERRQERRGHCALPRDGVDGAPPVFAMVPERRGPRPPSGHLLARASILPTRLVLSRTSASRLSPQCSECPRRQLQVHPTLLQVIVCLLSALLFLLQFLTVRTQAPRSAQEHTRSRERARATPLWPPPLTPRP